MYTSITVTIPTENGLSLQSNIRVNIAVTALIRTRITYHCHYAAIVTFICKGVGGSGT